MIEYPIDTSRMKILCSICKKPLKRDLSRYPNPVCDKCDRKALNARGKPARHMREYPEYRKRMDMILFADGGDNPVFIDGKKCWRRYKFGGWITMLDKNDGKDIGEFYKRGFLHKPRSSPKR